MSANSKWTFMQMNRNDRKRAKQKQNGGDRDVIHWFVADKHSNICHVERMDIFNRFNGLTISFTASQLTASPVHFVFRYVFFILPLSDVHLPSFLPVCLSVPLFNRICLIIGECFRPTSPTFWLSHLKGYALAWIANEKSALIPILSGFNFQFGLQRMKITVENGPELNQR